MQAEIFAGSGSTYQTAEGFDTVSGLACRPRPSFCKDMAIAAATLLQNIIEHHGPLAEVNYHESETAFICGFRRAAWPSSAMVAAQTTPLADSGPQDPSPQIFVPIPRYTLTALEIETRSRPASFWKPPRRA